ncbi:Uncharacterised protein [Escherichia coli]|nr:Uncharacterised protein [Escherichia coli]
MGWELHIVRTEHWFDSASVPISSEEWLQLVNDDKELSIDNKNGDSYAIWSGQSEHDEPRLKWNDTEFLTLPSYERIMLYCNIILTALLSVKYQ